VELAGDRRLKVGPRELVIAAPTDGGLFLVAVVPPLDRLGAWRADPAQAWSAGSPGRSSATPDTSRTHPGQGISGAARQVRAPRSRRRGEPGAPRVDGPSAGPLGSYLRRRRGGDALARRLPGAVPLRVGGRGPPGQAGPEPFDPPRIATIPARSDELAAPAGRPAGLGRPGLDLYLTPPTGGTGMLDLERRPPPRPGPPLHRASLQESGRASPSPASRRGGGRGGPRPGAGGEGSRSRSPRGGRGDRRPTTG